MKLPPVCFYGDWKPDRDRGICHSWGTEWKGGTGGPGLLVARQRCPQAVSTSPRVCCCGLGNQSLGRERKRCSIQRRHADLLHSSGDPVTVRRAEPEQMTSKEGRHSTLRPHLASQANATELGNICSLFPLEGTALPVMVGLISTWLLSGPLKIIYFCAS